MYKTTEEAWASCLAAATSDEEELTPEHISILRHFFLAGCVGTLRLLATGADFDALVEENKRLLRPN